MLEIETLEKQKNKKDFKKVRLNQSRKYFLSFFFKNICHLRRLKLHDMM